MIKREIVPLNALRAFEAAGRHLSFVEAAAELHVTPAAISHHVKMLEDFVGTPLFVRRHRSIEITDAGRSCLDQLRESFQQIESVTQRLRHASRCGPLRVRVASCLASKWLLPRLNDFFARHPEIDLEVSVSSQIYQFRYAEMDALLRLRCGDFNGMNVEPFMTEHVSPVCTPEFLRQHGPIRSAADIARLPLVHDDTLNVIPTFPNWSTWLRQQGVEIGDDLPGHRFDFSPMVLDATLEGRGIALGRSALVADHLAAGRLVRPLGTDYPVTHDYFLIYPHAAPKQKQIQIFQNWLRVQAAETGRVWSGRDMRRSAVYHESFEAA